MALQWREVPARCGKWQSIYDRFNSWRKDGTLDRLLERLHPRLNEEGRLDYALGNIDATSIRASRAAAGARRGKNQPYAPAGQALSGSRGGWGTKVHRVVDGGGIPLAATVTAGQAHESKQAAATLEQVCLPNGKGRPTCRPKKLAGDKASSDPAVRAYLRRRGILPVMPTRKNPRFDQATYKKRNVVERCVGWRKENRQLATCHAKRAANYLATVQLAMIRRCLHLLHGPSDRT